MGSAELLAPGSRLGRYEIIEALGAGAMGQVYLARDISLNRRVAIKTLGHVHLNRADLRKRFAREARAVAQISHPNVVQIFDISEDQERPYFVMEYLKGTDVDQLLRKRGRLTMSETVAIGLSTALGLSEAAAAGVVHRDVKPANLFLTDRGVVKVTDFGLAKGFALGANLTGDGITLGTPDYMPPEQGQGLPVDTRADIYALGATLFHLLAGHAPYRGADEKVGYAEVVVRHIKQPIPRLEDEVPDIDPDLARLVGRMMSKDPAERPTYEEIVAQLRHVALSINARVPSLSGSGSASFPPSTSGERHDPTGPTVHEGSAPSGDRPRGRLPVWLIGSSVASLVIFLGAAALYLYIYLLPPPPAPKAPDPGTGTATGRASMAELQKMVPPGSVLLRSSVTGPIAVSRLPVSLQQVRQVAPQLAAKVKVLHGQAAGGLSLDDARIITHKLGGRLPTHVEWALIEASRKAEIYADDCEWVDDGPTEDTRCFKGHHEVVLSDPRARRAGAVFRVVKLLEVGTAPR
jgi:serine/threonine protein kinase